MKVKTDYDDLKVKAIMNNMREGQSIEDELYKTMEKLYEQVPSEVRDFISALNGEETTQKQKVEEKQKEAEKQKAEPKRVGKKEQKQKDASTDMKMEEMPPLHM